MNKANNDIISDSFDMVPLEGEIEEENVEENKSFKIVAQESQFEDDVEYARDNILKIIKLTSKASEEIAGLAEQSQNNKDYDAFSKVAKTALEANKDLLQIHKDRKEVQQDITQNNVNNNLFVGSTKEILELLSKKEAEEVKKIE